MPTIAEAGATPPPPCVDKRELKCACVGGDSNVPLGFVSLTVNLMMVGMAIWMILKPAGLGH